MAKWQGLKLWRRVRRQPDYSDSIVSVDRLSQAWQPQPGPGSCPTHPSVPLFQAEQKGDFYCPLCRAERERNTGPMQSLRPLHQYLALHPERRMTTMLPCVKRRKEGR